MVVEPAGLVANLQGSQGAAMGIYMHIWQDQVRVAACHPLRGRGIPQEHQQQGPGAARPACDQLGRYAGLFCAVSSPYAVGSTLDRKQQSIRSAAACSRST